MSALPCSSNPCSSSRSVSPCRNSEFVKRQLVSRNASEWTRCRNPRNRGFGRTRRGKSCRPQGRRYRSFPRDHSLSWERTHGRFGSFFLPPQKCIARSSRFGLAFRRSGWSRCVRHQCTLSSSQDIRLSRAAGIHRVADAICAIDVRQWRGSRVSSRDSQPAHPFGNDARLAIRNDDRAGSWWNWRSVGGVALAAKPSAILKSRKPQRCAPRPCSDLVRTGMMQRL